MATMSNLEDLVRQAGVTQRLRSVFITECYAGATASIEVDCPMTGTYSCPPIRLPELRLGRFGRVGEMLSVPYNEGELQSCNPAWPEGACKNCGTKVELVPALARVLLARFSALKYRPTL